MSRKSTQCTPVVEGLETRLALSSTSPTAPTIFLIVPGPPGVGTSQGTLAILEAFSKTYLSHKGQSNYNPAFDFNHNGQIGMTDALALLRSLPPVSAKIPLSLNVTVAPKDKARGPVPPNSGGATYVKVVTIDGHTTPGALIFTGTGTVDWKLPDPVIVADAKGNFSLTLDQSTGINELDFLAVDHYGQQSRLSYPMLWLGFSQYEAAHPQNT